MLIFPRSTIWTTAAAAAMLSAGRPCSAGLVTVFNPSFEQPVVTDPSGLYDHPSAAAQGAGPGDSPWMFAIGGAAGGGSFAAKGAKYSPTGVVPQPPDGNQVLLLEGVQPTGQSATQQVTFPAAGQYTLTFDDIAAEVDVAVFGGGSAATVGTAQHAPLPGSQFEQTSIPLTISTPGAYLLQLFDPPNAGTASIDNVSITSAPEPACAMLLGLGLVLIRRREI